MIYRCYTVPRVLWGPCALRGVLGDELRPPPRLRRCARSKYFHHPHNTIRFRWFWAHFERICKKCCILMNKDHSCAGMGYIYRGWGVSGGRGRWLGMLRSRGRSGGVLGPGGSAETSVGCPGTILENIKIFILERNFRPRVRISTSPPPHGLEGMERRPKLAAAAGGEGMERIVSLDTPRSAQGPHNTRGTV